MENLQSIAGKNGCGAGNSASTGKLGCQIEFGSPIHLFKLKKGTVIPKETVFNKAYLDGLTKTNVLVPIVDASSFEDVSGEDSMSTNSRGVERLNLLGLPKYKLMFEEGHEFYRQMAKLKSFKSADFLIGDEFGNIKIAINSDGDFTGFSAGQVLPEMTKTKSFGGDGESKSLTVQFLNRNQFDEDYTILTSAQLGFDLVEIQGVNPVNVTFNEIPANAATTIKVEVKLAADNSTNVEGLVLGDFLVQKTGNINLNVSAVAEANGVYTLTVDALATNDVVDVQLFDSANNVSNVLNEGVLYKSNVVSETVIV